MLWSETYNKSDDKDDNCDDVLLLWLEHSIVMHLPSSGGVFWWRGQQELDLSGQFVQQVD